MEQNKSSERQKDMKTTISTSILVALIASIATAQGLFSGLANRQDEIKNAEEAFGKVFSSYKPFFLIKGEMGKKDDGSPDIAIDGEGKVQVAIKLDIDKAEYDEWLVSATNTFAKYASRVLAPGERPTSEDSGKPKIRVGETVFVFAEDLESAIDSAKEARMPQEPCIAVFLVDGDGKVVAEPDSKRSERGTSIEEDIKIYTSQQKLQNGGNAVSDVFMWLFCGGDWTDLGEMAWMMRWQDVVKSVTGRQPSQFLDSDFFNRHRLTTKSFPDNGPLEQISGWHSDFGYKGAKTKMISFGKLPKEELEAVQGVRVCIGGVQYVDFLKELKNRSGK
jgi:hypothetical protein